MIRAGTRPKLDGLVDLMTIALSRQSTDPRDKIFAFFGLCDKSEWGILPDYELPVEQVYIAFAKANLCLSCQPDKVLSISGVGNPMPEPELNLPTWVPDWRAAPTRTVPFSCLQPGLFTAGLGKTGSTFTISPSNTLKFRGLHFGKVIDVLPPGPHWGQANMRENTGWKSFLFRNPKHGNWKESVDGITPLMLLIRTICADMDPTERGGRFLHLRSLNQTYFLGLLAAIIYDLLTAEDGLFTLLQDESSSSPEFGMLFEKAEPEKPRQIPENTTLMDYAGEVMTDSFFPAMVNRCLFIGENLPLGLAPPLTREGDIVAILYGCRFPYILRAEGDFYSLVGQCFAPGLMYGEAVSFVDDGGQFSESVFEII
jgi:hypothetical protein